MRETDDHFSAAQIAALDRLGIAFSTVPRKRVAIAMLEPAGIADDPHTIPIIVARQPICPIVKSDDVGDLIILPDGEERWVQA